MANAFEVRETFSNDMAKFMREKKTVPWQVEGVPAMMPKSATTDRSYNGLNALYLLAKAGEKGYKDPRWVTVNAANEHGFHVKKDEHGVPMEFWSQNEQTGKNEVRTYTVFNMQQLNVNFPLPESQLEPNYRAANVMLHRMGVEIPIESPQEDYQAAFKKVAERTVGEAGFHEDVHTDDLIALRVNLAYTMMMHKAHLHVVPDKDAPVQSWAFSISHNPRAMTDAIRDASKVVNIMEQDIERPQTMPEMTHATQALRAEAAQEHAEAQRASEIIDGATTIPRGMDNNLPGAGLSQTEENIHASVDKANTEVRDMATSANEKEAVAGKSRFAAATEMAKEKLGPSTIVSNAQPGQSYTGKIVGLVGHGPDAIAVQRITDNQAVLHKIKDMAAETNVEVGAKLTISKGSDGKSIAKGKDEMSRTEEREERSA